MIRIADKQAKLHDKAVWFLVKTKDNNETVYGRSLYEKLYNR